MHIYHYENGLPKQTFRSPKKSVSATARKIIKLVAEADFLGDQKVCFGNRTKSRIVAETDSTPNPRLGSQI